jgi:transcriptional regulator with XRE-family HTH domain
MRCAPQHQPDWKLARNSRVSARAQDLGMPIRRDPVRDAERRARWQLDEVLRDLRAARQAAGTSQRAVAAALGHSPQLVSAWELGDLLPDPIQLARWGAAVGLDVTLRAHAGGSPLRDAGQLRILARARATIGEEWAWQTEVAVSANPLDRRAFDAVLSRGEIRIGLEVISRLMDAQAQLRGALLKQQAARLDRVVLVVARTRHNRAALQQASASLAPAFPLDSRELGLRLRAGRMPGANGVLVV